jgi:hypothetical protein
VAGLGTKFSDQTLHFFHEFFSVMSFKFLPRTQRSGVFDAIDKQSSVQMINLVLKRPGGHASHDEIQVVSEAIPSLNAHDGEPTDAASQIRH